jgi:hypothetical protein
MIVKPGYEEVMAEVREGQIKWQSQHFNAI